MPAVQSTMKKQKVKAMKVMKLAMKSTKSSDDDTKKGSDGKGGNTMKKPAGAPSKSTIADAVKEMQRGVGEELEQDESEKRDKGKAEKFKAMRSQLPSHIINPMTRQRIPKARLARFARSW